MSCAGNKSIHFFVAIKKPTKFKWIKECEKAFMELKQFLSALPVLVHPKENSLLILYLAVSEKAISWYWFRTMIETKHRSILTAKFSRSRESLSED